MKITLNIGCPSGIAEYDVPPFIDGDTITYRQMTWDFSQLLEGAEIVLGDPFFGPVKRTNGNVELWVNYMYNPQTSEPNQSTDWADYTFNIEVGQCPDPIKRKEAGQNSNNLEGVTYE